MTYYGSWDYNDFGQDIDDIDDSPAYLGAGLDQLDQDFDDIDRYDEYAEIQKLLRECGLE